MSETELRSLLIDLLQSIRAHDVFEARRRLAQVHDVHEDSRRAAADAARQRLVEAARRSVPNGRIDDDIDVYLKLFGPDGDSAELAAKWRVLDAELRRCLGGPVLLTVRQQPTHLGLLSGAGLIVSLDGSPGIYLPVTSYVTDTSRKGRAFPGPLPLTEDAEVIIGLEAVRQYAYERFLKGGDTLGNMLRSLGVVFPETDQEPDDS